MDQPTMRKDERFPDPGFFLQKGLVAGPIHG